MKLYFNLNFKANFGEQLQLVVSEKDHQDMIHSMTYTDNGNWLAEVDYFSKNICYQYQLVDQSGNVITAELAHHHLVFPHNVKEFKIFDTWNNRNYPENYLNNKILQNKNIGFKPEKITILRKHTHHFRIEAPLYQSNWRMVILGNVEALGNWEYLKTVPMYQTQLGIWEASVEIPDQQHIQYKYGIMDMNSGDVFSVEYGDNRWVIPNNQDEILIVKADHYFRFKSNELYHAAGVAVPVFSLRSNDGFGVGEFPDLEILANWAKATDLGIVQILPINDTTANHTWTDSYPYAAISVYALHPQYLSIQRLSFSLNKDLKEEYEKEKEVLNRLEQIDYERVMQGKWKFVKSIYQENYLTIIKDKSFKKFISENESWLLPYSAFCVLRDKYKTPNFNLWKTHKKYIAGKVAPMFSPKNKEYQEVMFHAWVQFQLHEQLSKAVDYLHKLGISVKGDLPIGIYRYSVEAWTEPSLFGMDFQAGAPPDQFTELGQNWEFPTYNWEAMKEDGYQWWKNRFKALEKYFDAMRIDHILGFFRIWRMPASATQGILGYFYPAVPVRLQEFYDRGIDFNYDRFCKPYINDQILFDYFGFEKEAVHHQYMNNHFDGTYSLKEEFDSQRKIKEYFSKDQDNWIGQKLLSLCANVLFLTEENNGETVYHPRFNLHKTDSCRYLSAEQQQLLYDLSMDYFFKRQDQLWYQSAMEKLPQILDASEMLICGEDLGLVPDCVPEVMDRLAITALKVQRMPSDNIPYYNPKNASYLNVVTASSHDSSTLRQWWQEDRNLTIDYFKNQLQQKGSAPGELVPELAEIILKQHLYNDAMLAIFPIQEFLATDDQLRNPNQDVERINVPAIFPHYWRYRMHIPIEDLLHAEHFNSKISGWITGSGRK